MILRFTKNEAFHLHHEGLSNKSWSNDEGIKIKIWKFVHEYFNTFVSLMKSFNSLTKFLTLKNPCYKNLPKSGEILNVDFFKDFSRSNIKVGLRYLARCLWTISTTCVPKFKSLRWFLDEQFYAAFFLLFMTIPEINLRKTLVVV